jgi:hypothetical protein
MLKPVNRPLHEADTLLMGECHGCAERGEEHSGDVHISVR